MPDWIAAAARNMAGWHASSLAALGLSSQYTDCLWSCRQPGPPIYLGAIVLSNRDLAGLYREIEQLAASRSHAPFGLCDSWSMLALQALGFEGAETGVWYARATQPPPTRLPMPELAIEEVTTPAQLVEFEAAAIEGFEAPQLHGLGSLGLHAAEILHDPRMKIYAGRVGGRVVSVSMAYLDSQVVGVYGVATLPAYRRRGFGEAMTWRAVLSQPDWPAVLQPSPLGAPVYRRMGFQEIGRFTSWFYPGIGE